MGAMVCFVALCYRTLPYNLKCVPLLGRLHSDRAVECGSSLLPVFPTLSNHTHIV